MEKEQNQNQEEEKNNEVAPDSASQEVEGEKKRAPKASAKSTKSVSSIPQEKTTLGDLDVLSSLKDSIEKEEAKK